MNKKSTENILNIAAPAGLDHLYTVKPGKPYRVHLLNNKVKNIQLFGLTFDANKCFLLPYALPGIKKIVKKHKEFPDHKILIVGHDGSDEDFGGVAIAYHRAKVISEYLKENVDAWLAWFKDDKPARVRWGLREIQLMLSALPEEGFPYYLGNASGVNDQRSVEGVKRFQKDSGLTSDGIPGPKTQKALVEAYMALTDTSLASDAEITVHGCEGKFEDDLPLRGIHPDTRVVEVMLFENKIVPKPKNITSLEGDMEYFAWKQQVVDTDFYQFHGIHVQILDKYKRPLRATKVELDGVIRKKGYTDDQGFIFFTGLHAGDYEIYAVINRERIKTASLTYPTAKVNYINH